MSESNIPKGPWTRSGQEENYGGDVFVHGADRRCLARIWSPPSADGSDTRIAVADMMRSAPELYEALRKAISNLEMAEVNSYAFEGDDDPEYIGAKEAWQRDIEFFRAVLLKATPEGVKHSQRQLPRDPLPDNPTNSD